MNAHNWIDLAQDADTGIETLRAHFTGHAYDPHWHDSYLVGVTEEGVQQFHCRRERFHSTPGKVFLLEPGEIHDGDAPTEGGFTYRMLYLDPQWLERELSALFEEAPADSQLSFANNLASDQRLAQATSTAFHSLHHGELRIVRQSAMDQLLDQLTDHLHWRKRYHQDPRLPLVAHQARDYLHAHAQQDISLDELGAVCGVDRFRLTRAFKAAYGLPPHAYLVQLRLAKARRLLARGEQPAEVAMALGFADQSHMGRWFVRAYGLTPAAYRKRCSNLPDA
ncbi:AraC family transcriptional regulator [Pseudomonas chlororaphis]|uniref:AraC family transcriptional regulator n=1 Tax=Pseudomonas chlororaphis TaxID=587753 RepID=UPI0007B373CB|nr:AraC family transcriptional regulator [Pseudomonas chlororaphis]AZC51050.1 Transcriptional regulator, AraC family [Pseudomonas chlororaphis subsp. piscium]AZC57628.1 Transcriptional regulator, AraC family [Pseudomonas chlororaphis subsp. piscium]AZC63841.1 Transcriptional regulator, AraC family [Pseudomonas chlororaphis subsp. piscium]AZC70079.1 Transcriptional regulator, AraC family [Pseudomonas chlororaphis subsp. piscium]AZC76343.1 Transcriptional regulator, AraC family [Pseudomonas chlo